MERWICDKGEIEIVETVSSGGQGTVYKAKIRGNLYALKVYNRNYDPAEREKVKERLNKIITKRGIDPDINLNVFILPQSIAESGNKLGYIMEFLSERYKSLDHIMDKDPKFIFEVCINLCQAFHNLHSAGLSYKDISCRNVYFDEQTGKVKIIDSDNVSSDFKESEIKGTGDFMAPELVENKVKQPSETTDLYSLAVLLFKLLFGDRDPRFSSDSGNVMRRGGYGFDAKFIYEDEANLNKYDNDEDRAKNWRTLPEFLRDLFRKAFMKGIKDPESRPTADDWLEAFIKLRGLAYECPKCGLNFLNEENYEKSGYKLFCPDCRREIKKPVMETSHKGYIVLEDSDTIYTGYFKDFDGDKSTPAFSVSIENQNTCILKCLSAEIEKKVGRSVLCTVRRGISVDVEIGRHKYKLRYPF